MTAGTLHVVDPNLYRKHLAKMQLQDGECVEIRITRAEEAKKHWQLKFYYGYIIKQCCENGDTVKDMDTYFRALFLPPDVATISQMSYEQMRDYLIQCEEHAARVMGVVVTGPDEIRKRVA